jgi:hypothetical protein
VKGISATQSSPGLIIVIKSVVFRCVSVQKCVVAAGCDIEYWLYRLNCNEPSALTDIFSEGIW